MLEGQIYEVQASYTARQQAPDRVAHELIRSEDDTHPVWGIACHFPAWRADESIPSNGDHWEIVPHVLLEHYAARFGYDHEDVSGIVDAVLHHTKIPDLNDSLAWMQPQYADIMKAVRDMPDFLDPRMPYEERREVVAARTEAAKAHLLQVVPAPIEDRQGALDWRRGLLERIVEDIRSQGGELDERFLLGIDDVAPDDPLEALTSAPLDPRRVRAMRARDEYEASRSGQPPMTFGMDRVLPPGL